MAPVTKKKPKKRAAGAGRPRAEMGEIGKPGLREFGGYIREEWLPDLIGRAGVRALKTMIGTDATIAAIGNATKMAVKQVNFFMQPGGPTDNDVACYSHINHCLFDWLDMPWQMKLNEIMTFGDYGWAVFEKVMERRDDGTISWAKWGFRPQETLLRWVPDPNTQEIIAMDQQVYIPASQVLKIPLEKCVHFTLNGTKGNPEGQSWYRGAYMAWYAKHKLELIEMIGIERNLAGLPDVKIPAENWLPKNKKVLARYQELANTVHRNEDASFVTPSDPWPGTSLPMFQVGLVGGQQLTTRGTGLPTIQPIQRYQAEIARCLLADFMLLPQGGPGSFALATNKSSFFVRFIESLCDLICDVINAQAIPELVEMNTFGTLTDMPRLVHGSVARTDVADLGKLLANLYKAGATDLFPNDPLLNSVLAEAGLNNIDTQTNEEMSDDEDDESEHPPETAAEQMEQQVLTARLQAAERRTKGGATRRNVDVVTGGEVLDMGGNR